MNKPKYHICNDENRNYDENKSHTIENDNNDVIMNGSNIYKIETDIAMKTMFTFTTDRHATNNWKLVL